MRLEFLASDLKRMLGNASLFACKDKTLPYLCVVRFAWHEDWLYMVASNRYIMSWERVAILVDGYPEANRTDFSISDNDVRNMLKAWPKKTLPGTRAEIVTGSEGGSVTVGTAVTFPFSKPEGDFVRGWRLIVDATENARAVENASFDAGLLALFAKVKVDGNSGTTMRLTFGESDRKPSRVSMGTCFNAAVMPIRSAG